MEGIPVTEGDQISRQLTEMAVQFAELRKDLTELRVAFASLRATVDSQQQAAKGSTDINWKWISLAMGVLLFLLGIIMAASKK